MKRTPREIPQNYAVDRWGDGYFTINAKGEVEVAPRGRNGSRINLCKLADEIRSVGLGWPVLVRFMDILSDRIEAVQRAFREASEESGYQGDYTIVYPIKVNQQHSVIETIASFKGGGAGLETGSKSELLGALVHAGEESVVVCNGYKDREYIRIALIGSLLVRRLYIVIEKPSELAMVLHESSALGIPPRLGVRVRLASKPSGKWQDSGGIKSKFGLSASQLLELIHHLRAAGQLDRLQLLHSHLGSQIPNIRDIRHAMGEVARFYSQLLAMGVPIAVIDVGGGLGVDYEGTGTRNYCSINYSPQLYAREVVSGLQRLCDAEGLAHPEIFSESGRAITAHHAVLITNVVESEAAPGAPPEGLADLPEPHPTLQRLSEAPERIGEVTPTELYREARQDLEEMLWMFEQGLINLQERALAEGFYFSLCSKLLPVLRLTSSRHRELIDELNEKLADKIFCNFSLFQSMPDTWAIAHIFPVMPLQRLNEIPDRKATIHDLTCDSDGCIGAYVDQDGVETTFPIHAVGKEECYLLGMFLVGAYQEILGDIHNLFGDAHAINVVLDDNGGYRLLTPEQGDRVEQLLEYIHFDPETIVNRYREALARSVPDTARRQAHLEELQSGLRGYTYLKR